jgi:hypothetical protein
MIGTITCRSCGDEVFWIESETGKKMPVDAKPEKRIILMQQGGVPVLSVPDGNPIGKVVDVYTSHFATCPDATKWRKK